MRTPPQAEKRSDTKKACLLLFRLQVIAMNYLSFPYLPHPTAKRWKQAPIRSVHSRVLCWELRRCRSALRSTPSAPSPLDALTNAKRRVCSMLMKAPVRRKSGAYPLLLDDKSVRLTVLFQILSAAQRLPLSRHLSRNGRNQTQSCRGQKQNRRQSWLYFQEFPQQNPASV